jgi:hypothetical protein
MAPLSLLYNTYQSSYYFRSFIHELRSSKYNNSILGLALRCIAMALHFVVKSVIFETAAFAVASIVGYLVVYRWFRILED